MTLKLIDIGDDDEVDLNKLKNRLKPFVESEYDCFPQFGAWSQNICVVQICMFQKTDWCSEEHYEHSCLP